MGTDGFVVSHRRVVGALSAFLSLTAAVSVGSCSTGAPAPRDTAPDLHVNHFHLCESKLRTGDLAGALEHLRAYQRQARQLAAREPGNLSHQLAESYGYSNVAAIYQRQGNLQAASDSFRQSIVLQDRLLSRSAVDLDVKHRRAVCLIHRGVILRALGETDLAEQVLDAALVETEAMTQLDSSNVNWLRAFASANVAAARLDLDGERTLEAIDRLHASRAILSALLKQHPARVAVLRDLANVHVHLADALRAERRLAAASREIGAAAAVARRMSAERDHDTLRTLAAVRAGSGALAMAYGDRWQATVDYEAAAGVLRLTIPDTRDHHVLELWTRIMLALGRGFDARQTFARLDEMGFREPSLMALRAPK